MSSNLCCCSQIGTISNFFLSWKVSTSYSQEWYIEWCRNYLASVPTRGANELTESIEACQPKSYYYNRPGPKCICQNLNQYVSHEPNFAVTLICNNFPVLLTWHVSWQDKRKTVILTPSYRTSYGFSAFHSSPIPWVHWWKILCLRNFCIPILVS